jgi:hypothetical protein
MVRLRLTVIVGMKDQTIAAHPTHNNRVDTARDARVLSADPDISYPA